MVGVLGIYYVRRIMKFGHGLLLPAIVHGRECGYEPGCLLIR